MMLKSVRFAKVRKIFKSKLKEEVIPLLFSILKVLKLLKIIDKKDIMFNKNKGGKYCYAYSRTNYAIFNR